MVKEIYRDYSNGKHTYRELEQRHGIGRKTIRKAFDAYNKITGEITIPTCPLPLVMDAFFFSQSEGCLVFRALKKNLYWLEIQGEKISYYRQGLETLIAMGANISSVTIDGRRGVKQLLLQMFPDLPIQSCQFHQELVVTHHISQRPKSEAGKELYQLTRSLTRTTRKEFTGKLTTWMLQWDVFMHEQSTDESKRGWHYTHDRLWKAYRSLKANLPYLFTYLDHPELNIPNTTNSCDGYFAHLKQRLKIHRGLSKKRRKQMLDYFLENGLW